MSTRALFVPAAVLAAAVALACSPPTAATNAPASPANRFTVQIWADNWFSLYVNDEYVGEDSVPITTERSFNAETLSFTATRPFDLNVIVRDYIQNDTGLEYIGTPQQQMGDGGFILQLIDSSNSVPVAASSSAMRCLVLHKAPLNASCERDPSPSTTCQHRIIEEPQGWKARGYDVSTWERATEYTPAQIGVKDGYLAIAWHPAARLIWTSDLKADNTLLCKLSVTR